MRPKKQPTFSGTQELVAYIHVKLLDGQRIIMQVCCAGWGNSHPAGFFFFLTNYEHFCIKFCMCADSWFMAVIYRRRNREKPLIYFSDLDKIRGVFWRKGSGFVSPAARGAPAPLTAPFY
ncbi:MAG: hypothetical protein E7331_08510 [Clostridiales bacterium]|nr:hypothetical protein [Clostridiales bacterium]